MRRQLLLAPLVVCVFALTSVELGSESAGVKSAMAQMCEQIETQLPIAGCVSYRQKLKKRSLDVILKSRCKEQMSCTVSWELKCDGDAKPRPKSSVFALMGGGTEIVNASADACGEDGWRIRNVTWSCKSDE